MYVADGNIVETTWRGTFSMPVANIREIRIGWVPYGPPAIYLESNVGNVISLRVTEDTENTREQVGKAVRDLPLATRLTEATRAALRLAP
ncbi:hypothetical protein [Aeromicrobium sp. UC242_57]|uniref:hypothetical protein n=1 Tax=Aeromicrobium sp. UC242_57 TaxID=3374624 RepID=UPI00378E1216